MEIYIAALMIFAMASVGLSLGVIVKGKQIKGHCGSKSEQDTCTRDEQGNKIESCSTCSCEE